MTKKHFEAMADIIWNGPLSDDQKLQLAQDMANYFLTQNPRFDPERFINRATGQD